MRRSIFETGRLWPKFLNRALGEVSIVREVIAMEKNLRCHGDEL